jgi:hypothetical protein
MQTMAHDDILVSRHGYAEDWELDGPATPDAIRSHIAGLETAATEDARAGYAFSAGLLVLRADAWRRQLAAVAN